VGQLTGMMAQTQTKQKIIRTEGEFPYINDIVICPTCKKEVDCNSAYHDPTIGGKTGKLVHKKCLSKEHRAEIKADEIKYTAKILNLMQELCNDGRGVSCIREVVFWLERGEEKKAKLVIEHDWDKIANYPEIAEFLKEQKLAKKDWYITGETK